MPYSVIIPAYNASQWIVETLDSVIGQTLPAEKIIVVDDASTDDTAQIAAKYPQVTVHSLETNSRQSVCRNIGASLTNSKYLAFLDADDIWHPNHAESLVAILESSPEASAALAKQSYFSHEDAPSFALSKESPVSVDLWNAFPLHAGASTPSAVIIRRNYFEKAGQWREDLNGVEDFFMWLTLSSMAPLGHSKSNTIAKREHQSSRFQQVMAGNPMERMRLRYEAAKIAVRDLEKLGAHPIRVRNAKSRLDFYGLILGYANACLENNKQALRQTVAAISRYVSTENKKTIMSPAGIISYLRDQFPLDNYAQLEPLYLYWPDEHPAKIQIQRILAKVMDRDSILQNSKA